MGLLFGRLKKDASTRTQSRSGVLGELESSKHAGDTYRAVYTVRLAGAVYALHAFQKKSKRGIATPKQEIALMCERLRRAEDHYFEWSREKDRG